MLSKETKDKINNARDILVGQLPLPSDQIELITIALIYKFMDDIDEESRKLGGEISFFRNGLSNFSWQKLLSNQLSGEERVQKFIRAIEAITKAPHIPELFKSVFRNTFLKFRDSRTLKLFLDEINKFKYEHSEELGNAFEYLLDSMGSQGENGQFRTPRNIIDFIIEVVDPDKVDKILDPACGTAGFLISAYKHILRKYTNGYEDYRVSLKNYEIDGISIHWGDKLKKTEIDKLTKRIEGYDITPLMVRLSQVNMYLHHFPSPLIHDYDTLTNKNRWEDKFDCIFANPPFMTPKGGVEPHEQFRIRAKKAEILFSDYIIEHLNPNGKAGWIVPEGIIFQGSGDYVTLRKWLIENMGLWAVVSLPAGIFQPYSGVKTSILFVDRVLARNTKSIMLVKVENDGFSLNTNRNPITDNDLPNALNLLMDYKKLAASIEGNPEESDGKLAELAEKYPVKFKVLNRKEFAKLDSYKAVSSTIDFCKREYKRFLTAKVKYEESYQKAKDEKQKQKALDTFHKNQKYFIDVTGLGAIPFDEVMIKQWVNEKLKDDAVKYGEDRANIVKLSQELSEHLDNEREFNLSLENYLPKNEIEVSFEIKKVEECLEKFTYPEKILAKQYLEVGKYPIVDQSENFIAGYTNDESYLIEINKPLIVFGDHTRIVKYIDFNFCLGADGVKILMPNNDFIPRFFYFLIRSVEVENLGYSRHFKILKSKEIPVPPTDIQQKIIDEIEGYQKVIDGCNLVINNYKPSFKIDESWERVKLGEVCEITSSKRIFQSEYVSDGIPFYRTKEIVELNEGKEISLELFISRERYDEIKQKFEVPKKGEILVSAVGTIGITWTIPDDREFYFKDGNLLWVRNIKDAYPDFLKIGIENGIKNNLSSLIDGAAYNALTIEKLKNLDIPLPSLEIQEQLLLEIRNDSTTINQCKRFRTQMAQKIKEVIDEVWGKRESGQN